MLLVQMLLSGVVPTMCHCVICQFRDGLTELCKEVLIKLMT